MSEFDAFARDYQKLVDENVRITGETSDYFAAYKAAYLARVVAPPPGGALLDYGCGVGALARQIASRLSGMRIDGFDPSPDSVRRIDPGVAGRGTFTSDPQDLGRNYDVAVLANVLHHIDPTERAGAIRDVSARLASGGTLVVFEHNPINPLTRWAVSRCPFDDGVVLVPTRDTSQWLTDAGLRVVRRDYIVFFPRLLEWLRPLEPALCWCPLGAQYVTVARNGA